MFERRTLAIVLAGTALAAAPVFAQEEKFRSEVSVQGFGSFVKETTQNGVRQDATNSGGVLANYRFFFTPRLGVELNYGYSLNTQRYQSAGRYAAVNSYSHETTAAYVVRFPFKNWTAFALAGGGAVVFNPKNAPSLDCQARAAFVYGGGVDVPMTKHFFVRAQYRGLLYKSPTYDIPGLSGMDRVTHRAEPSAGIGYRF